MRRVPFSNPLAAQGAEQEARSGASHHRRHSHAAAIGLLAAAVLLQLAGPAWAIAGGAALFIAGLPHGAFAGDGAPLIARRGYVPRYLALGMLAATAFILAPVPILAAFLALSAWHFLNEGGVGHPLRRAAIAGLSIGGSALVRAGETGAIFAALCGAPVPGTLMTVLGAIGIAAYVAAALSLARKPADIPLWVMTMSPWLLHPVLATALIFMLGHAGPVTAAIMRRRGWGPPMAIVLAGTSALLAGTAVLALPMTAEWLPWLAASALAVIVPHLLPERWLGVASAPKRMADQSSQSATSPAT